MWGKWDNYNSIINKIYFLKNQVELKSDNYGIKETTSIQTGRRGTDMEQAGPTLICGG